MSREARTISVNRGASGALPVPRRRATEVTFMHQRFLFVPLFVLGFVGACSKDPAPVAKRPDLAVGTVRSAVGSCPGAPSSCDLIPEKDTTVYAGATVLGKDYG